MVANFVAPRSGGIRTVLQQLAAGYAQRGHEVTVVVPGPVTRRRRGPWGTAVTIASPRVPGTGYRLTTGRSDLQRALAASWPERLEVHDRSSLLWLGSWARREGVPSLAVSHERLDRVLGQWLPGSGRAGTAAADAWNARLVEEFDTVVCTTGWAAEEFRRIGARPALVPLGVDLEEFRPRPRAPHEDPLLVVSSRLSREKRVDLAVDAVRRLAARGRRVRLVVAGDGPQRRFLERRAAGLPVEFTGFLRDRATVAALLASADVVLAPGPVETFGLSGLEALACGTPVVVHADTGLAEVLVPGAGLVAAGSPEAFATAVSRVLDGAADGRRARARAEQFPWWGTVQGFLRVHGLVAARR
nr:glycosyltransferase [Kineococcus siccus]